MTAIAVDSKSSWSRTMTVTGAVVSEIEYSPNGRCPMHCHEHSSLGIVLDGEVIKRFTDSFIRVEKGAAYTLPSGLMHSDDFAPQSRVVMIQLDESNHLTAERLRACQPAFAARIAIRDQRLGRLGQRIANELRRPDPVTAIAMDALVGEVLSVSARVCRDMADARRPGWLVEAREIARNHTRGRIQVNEIARRVGVHPAYLARRFRAEFGVTPAVYARNARLQWAADQLVHTDRAIADIADEAGFADQSHFTRAFRKYLDLTPAHYRDLYRRD